MIKMVPAPNHMGGGGGDPSYLDNDVLMMDHHHAPTTPGAGGGVDCSTKAPRIRSRRSGGWLSNLGGSFSGLGSFSNLTGPASPASPSIADDIRNDRELFFADDEPPQAANLKPSKTTAAASSAGRTMLSSGFGCRPQQTRPNQPRRSSVSSSSGRAMRRGSSQQKMDNLQREVDMALEYFSQETEAGLDDVFDDARHGGDEYLHSGPSPSFPGKYPRIDPEKIMARFGRLSSCDECDNSSLPGTAATSMATSVVTTEYDAEFGDCHFGKFLGEPPSSPSEPSNNSPSGGLSLKHKTKSIVSFPLSLIPSQAAMNCAEDDGDESVAKFDEVLSQELNRICLSEEQKASLDFNSNDRHQSLRNAMEPFLAVARIQREEATQGVFETLDRVMLPQEQPQERASRRASTSSQHAFSIGSTYGIPYPTLRNESSFLYDVESFPLDRILAETLGVEDLSKLHLDHPLKKDKGRLLASLQNRTRRRRFHQCFDSFVTSHVIPLLHSQALARGVFYTNRHQLQGGRPQAIVYRYQAFPSVNIVRPGENSTDPHCDMAQGHSVGNISYHIPLTATFGTNAVYTESRPGREDWHPLCTKSPGLGFHFDGARCLHFNLKNETDITRVSLNFRIAITRAPESGDIAYDPDDQLCGKELLKDKFSQDNPGFYDEVVVNVGDGMYRSLGPIATKRRSGISLVG